MFQHYAQYAPYLAQAQLVFFMLGMGATLVPADFLRVVRVPRFLLVGAFMQLAVLPLLAVGINLVSGVEPGIAVGLVLVAAMPGGALSKLFVYFGRGNVALCITLTTVLTLGTIVTVPLLLVLLASAYLPADFQMPVAGVVAEVGLFLLLPLAVGMGIGRLAPTRRHVISRWCVRIGLVFVVMVVVGSLGSGLITPSEYGWRAPIAIFLFGILGQQLAMLPFRLMKWPVADCLAVGIEATMRNINLAILLHSLLAVGRESDPIMKGVLFVVLFYGAAAFFMGAPLVLRYRLFKKGAKP